MTNRANELKTAGQHGISHHHGAGHAAAEDSVQHTLKQGDAALNELSVSKLGQSLQDYFNSAIAESVPDDLLALVDSLGGETATSNGPRSRRHDD